MDHADHVALIRDGVTGLRSHLGGHRRGRGRLHLGAGGLARAGRTDRRRGSRPAGAGGERAGGRRSLSGHRPGRATSRLRGPARPAAARRHRRGQQPAFQRARSPGRGGPAAGHAPPAGWRVRGRRVRHRPRQSVGPAPVQRGHVGAAGEPRPGWSRRRGSGGCRAGSSVRSTPRAACGRRPTTARPRRERQVAAASLGPSMRSPWRPTTGSAPPRVSHRTSPSPATSHGSSAVTITPVRSASPSSPMPGGSRSAVLGDGPRPCRRVRVRGDDQPRHDRQARHDAVRRPGERRHRHRTRAGAGEDGARATGGLDRREGR